MAPIPMPDLRTTVLLLGLLALAACDTGEGSASHFSAALFGAVGADLEGEATFGPVVEAGETRFRILLLADEGASGGVGGSIGFYFDGEDRPAVGAYAIGETEAVDVIIVLVDDQGAPALTGVSGTLTITESAPEAVSGTFDFEAETTFGGGETAVEGAFTAEPE